MREILHYRGVGTLFRSVYVHKDNCSVLSLVPVDCAF